MFCSKRLSTFFLNAEHHNIDQLSPSLETFLFNFDMLLDLGVWPNESFFVGISRPNQIMCKGIGMEGIPVVHLPHIRIYNCGHLVYDSHSNEAWDIGNDGDHLTSRILADEHGMNFYYPLRHNLQGEFMILCTFGDSGDSWW